MTIIRLALVTIKRLAAAAILVIGAFILAVIIATVLPKNALSILSQITSYMGIKDALNEDTITKIIISWMGAALAIFLDRQSRPRLCVTDVPNDRDNENPDPKNPNDVLQDPDHDNRPTKRKFLHVNVKNPPLWPVHSFFQHRNAALTTYGTIEFYTYPTNKQPLELALSIPAKWRDNFVPPFSTDYYKDKKLPRGFVDTRNIPSEHDHQNMGNHLDIAMKINDESAECFAHNLEAQFYQDHICRVETMKLKGRLYLVRVKLKTADTTTTACFKLVNHDYSDFKVTRLNTSDYAKITIPWLRMKIAEFIARINA